MIEKNKYSFVFLPNKMDSGWIYAFSNPQMPELLKIGMTTRDIEERLKDVNNTWNPYDFKIEIAKYVYDVKKKEKDLHLILTKYAERVNPNKEFFRISIKELTLFFNLIDGKYYNIKDDIVRCRNIQKCFIDKQKIRHKIGDNVWEGIYYSEKNIILSNEKEYGGRSPLNQFVINHYKTIRPDRTCQANAWAECEIYVKDKWISTFSLNEVI